MICTSKNGLNIICQNHVNYSINQFDVVYIKLRALCGSCKHVLSLLTGLKKSSYLDPCLLFAHLLSYQQC